MSAMFQGCRLALVAAGFVVLCGLTGCYQASEPIGVTVTRDGKVEQPQPTRP